MFDDGWRPRAVVFDCDGLLIDTEGCWTAAETELCARHGARFTAADEAALVGASVPAACARLAERIGGGAGAAEVQRELVARVTEIVARDGRAMPGAGSIVAALRVRVPVAVASNSPRPLLDQALNCGGLGGRFDATVAADEVAEPKPAPDLYRRACERLGTAPADALALEDSATGVAAATAAGLRTIAVPTLPGGGRGAAAVLDSLADPRLLAWIESWPLR